jgi:O-antigen/teichoic acid export membrane protein
MTQAQLLIVNTAATMLRMGLTVVLGLLTTRIAYQQLGEVAFGVYLTAIGVTSVLMVVVDSLSSSAQRYLAHAMGAKDTPRIASIAGSFVTLAGLGTIITAALGVLASPWIADGIQASDDVKRVLPAAVAWVIAGVALNVLQAPYRSYMIAKQSIVLVTAFEVLDSVATFAAAALLFALPSHSIVDLSFYTFLLRLIPTVATIGLCWVRFPEVLPRRPTEVREHLRFASWIAMGVTAWRLRTQGVQIAMNVIAGPIASAAYGVSLQLAMYQNNLSFAVYRAARPATIAAHGRKSMDHIRRIALGASKVMGMGNLLLAIPLLSETPGLLTLWLDIDEASPDMVAMARAVVLWISLRDLTIGHEMAVHATGRIARHETYVLTIDALALGLGCAAVYYWGSPPLLVYAVLLGVVAQTVMRVGLFSRAVGTTAMGWFYEVFSRYLLVAAISATIAATIVATMPASIGRIVLVVGACTVSTMLAAYKLGLNDDERGQFRSVARAIGGKITAFRAKRADHSKGGSA